MDNDRNAIDTVKVIFFLDGEQVPYSTISEKGQKGELGSGYGWTDHKEAILQYGEKFRYGVMFIRSKEEDKEEK